MSDPSIVLITGANSGLGYQIAKALYASTTPHAVIVCGRSLEKAQEAVQKLQKEVPHSQGSLLPLKIDITDDETITAAAEEVASRYGKLDALANNAGAWFDNHIEDGSMSLRQVWATTWNVNVVGAHAMTLAFAPLMVKSKKGRILFTTSDTASLTESELADSSADEQPYDKSPPSGWPKPATTPFAAYRCAKVGINMLTREWRKILRHDNVLTFCISPGFMATNLGGQADMLKSSGGSDPVAAGNFVRSVIEGERDHDAGKAIRFDGVQPW